MSGSPMSRITVSMPVGRGGELERGLAVRRDLHDVAVVLEQAAQDALEARVVLDEQEVHGLILRAGDGRAGRRQGSAQAAEPAVAQADERGAPRQIGIAKPRPSAFDGDRGVDADDVPGAVEQRAAAVAGIDRGVGLDQAAERRLAGASPGRSR